MSLKRKNSNKADKKTDSIPPPPPTTEITTSTFSNKGNKATANSDVDKSKNKSKKGDEEEDLDYGSASYWEERYKNKEEQGHEWYFTYTELSALLEPILDDLIMSKCQGKQPLMYSPTQTDILEIGCGDKPLSPEISQYITAELMNLETKKDAQKLSYESDTVSLIVDKGTLDAILSTPSTGPSLSIKVIQEVARCLSITGKFVLVSHLNVQDEAGAEWVEEVLSIGLLAGVGEEVGFDVEVCVGGSEGEGWSDDEDEHDENDDEGNDDEDNDEDNGDDGDDGEHSLPDPDESGNSNSGPAVYIITKILLPKSSKSASKKSRVKRERIEIVLSVH